MAPLEHFLYMSKLYTKSNKRNKRKILRFLGLGISIIGVCVILYIFTPYILYQINYAKVFASQKIVAPIPKILVVNNNKPQAVLYSDNSDGKDELLDAQKWFPTYNNIAGTIVSAKPRPTRYSLTIPKIGIYNAIVATNDYDLSQHIVNYQGTAIPPETGNAVLFGHSTLDWLYKPYNYKTVFTFLYKLSVGDQIIAFIDNQQYTYEIYNITVVNPDDTSVFAQSYDDSYLTLITCTPPGTTFQRLVIKSRLRR